MGRELEFVNSLPARPARAHGPALLSLVELGKRGVHHLEVS